MANVWLIILTFLAVHNAFCESEVLAQSFLQSSSSLDRSNRRFTCEGESIIFYCTLNGNGLVWESSPSLDETDEDPMIIYGFVFNDPRGTTYCDSLPYKNGTLFFVSAVLEYIDNTTCTSTMTITPVPNDNGFYPTSGESFEIICNASDGTSEDGQTWQFEVAADPDPVNVSDIVSFCYSAANSVVEVTIKEQEDKPFDVNYYEINVDNTYITNVSATSLSDNNITALFWRVDSEPQWVQVTTFDMCNKRSQPIMKKYTDTPMDGIATSFSKINIFILVIGVLVIIQLIV